MGAWFVVAATVAAVVAAAAAAAALAVMARKAWKVTPEIRTPYTFGSRVKSPNVARILEGLRGDHQAIPLIFF